MKVFPLIYIMLQCLMSNNLSAQDVNQYDEYYIGELVMLQHDSLASEKNIKEIKVFYREGAEVSKIIMDKQFGYGGDIQKLAYYDYPTGDSAVLKIINRDKNDVHFKTMVDYNALNNIFQSHISFFYFPLPDYRPLLNSTAKMQINTVDRVYHSLQDSLPVVSTTVNKHQLGETYILGPYWHYNDNIDKNQLQVKYDTSYLRDTMIVISRNKDISDGNISYLYKLSYLKGSFKKIEGTTYMKDSLSYYYLIDSEYDKEDRLVYYAESRQDHFQPLAKIMIKKITYTSNGNKEETVSRGGIGDCINELYEYNKSNQLIRLVTYEYSSCPFGVDEEKTQYYHNGLKMNSTYYRNGQFVNEFHYEYYFN